MTSGEHATEASIATSALTKNYGDFRALQNLNLSVRPGEVYGFLGPNGAGKTTTIKMLMGILVPTSGQAMICGLDCFKDRVEVKRRVGYLPDTPEFYDYLRGGDLFQFVGGMHGLSKELLNARQTTLFDELDLSEAEDEFVSNYSLGMKKKMALSLALVHQPDVLILDEPTTGLDPRAAQQIRRLIRSSAEAGRTVFLSTHLLDMAERLCDRVGIIGRGELIAEGEPSDLLAEYEADSLEALFLQLTGDDEKSPLPVDGGESE